MPPHTKTEREEGRLPEAKRTVSLRADAFWASFSSHSAEMKTGISSGEQCSMRPKSSWLGAGAKARTLQHHGNQALSPLHTAG